MKSFTKVDWLNREANAVRAICKGLVDQDSPKLAVGQSEGKVAKAWKIAASVTAFSATPQARSYHARRSNLKSNRYLTNVAMDQEGDDQLGGEADETKDWAEDG